MKPHQQSELYTSSRTHLSLFRNGFDNIIYSIFECVNRITNKEIVELICCEHNFLSDGNVCARFTFSSLAQTKSA